MRIQSRLVLKEISAVREGEPFIITYFNLFFKMQIKVTVKEIQLINKNENESS